MSDKVGDELTRVAVERINRIMMWPKWKRECWLEREQQRLSTIEQRMLAMFHNLYPEDYARCYEIVKREVEEKMKQAQLIIIEDLLRPLPLLLDWSNLKKEGHVNET